MTELPLGWETISLEELGMARTSSIDPSLFPNERFELFSVPSYSSLAPERPLGSEIGSTKQTVEPGDVMVCKIVPHINRVWVVPPRGEFRQIASSEWIVIRNSETEPKFLRWLMSAPDFRSEFLKDLSGIGGSLTRARPQTVAKIEIPLPPLPEQRRIVRKLDTLSARSTTARTHLTAIEKLVERMKGAVLSKALSGRLVASQLDCGEPTELGQFITGIEQGWSPKCENEPELDPTKWAVLTTTAIQAIDFDCAENKRLPESLSPRRHLEVKVGDVLMTRAGPRVRCAVCCYVAKTAPRRMFSDKVYRIRLDQSVEPEFFVMVMNAPEMVRALDAIKSGGSESGLNLTQDRLKSLEITLWDRTTQVEVVAEIKRQFDKIDRLAGEAEKALKLLGHLDQRILAKAFAGELVPQDPSDEPASVLLERIRAERGKKGATNRGRKPRAA